MPSSMTAFTAAAGRAGVDTTDDEAVDRFFLTAAEWLSPGEQADLLVTLLEDDGVRADPPDANPRPFRLPADFRYAIRSTKGWDRVWFSPAGDWLGTLLALAAGSLLAMAVDAVFRDHAGPWRPLSLTAAVVAFVACLGFQFVRSYRQRNAFLKARVDYAEAVAASGLYVRTGRGRANPFDAHYACRPILARTSTGDRPRHRSDTDSDTKLLLARLELTGRELISRLPVEVGSRTARNLESALREAIDPQPDRRWFDLAARGLLDAAAVESVSVEIAEPLLRVGKSLWADFDLAEVR